jgi:hypothetical protein
MPAANELLKPLQRFVDSPYKPLKRFFCLRAPKTLSRSQGMCLLWRALVSASPLGIATGRSAERTKVRDFLRGVPVVKFKFWLALFDSSLHLSSVEEERRRPRSANAHLTTAN